MTAIEFTRPHFVFNPGSARAARRPEDIEARAAALFPGSSFTATRGPGDAAAIARAARLDGADLVVAIGGDGTVNEVVNGLLTAGAVPATASPPLGTAPVEEAAATGSTGRAPALGILPAGSGSDFARTLGIPREIDRAFEVLAQGRRARIDVGLVECAKAGPDVLRTGVRRYFVNMAGCGASARVTQRFNSGFIPGVAGYAVAAATTAVTYRWPDVTMSVDGEAPRRVVLNALFVCNGQYCGGGMCVGAGAAVDDGLFLVVEAAGVSRLRAILQWPRLYRDLQHVRGVRVQAGRVAQVAPAGNEQVLVDCDGEVCGALPASYRIVPAALDVVVR